MYLYRNRESGDSISLVCENSISYVTSSAHEQEEKEVHVIRNRYLYNMYMYCTCTSEFLITFEAWAKLAQKWLVCAPLRIHLEPIN